MPQLIHNTSCSFRAERHFWLAGEWREGGKEVGHQSSLLKFLHIKWSADKKITFTLKTLKWQDVEIMDRKPSHGMEDGRRWEGGEGANIDTFSLLIYYSSLYSSLSSKSGSRLNR